MNFPLFFKEIFISSTAEGLNECLDLVNEAGRKFNFNFEENFALHTVIVESVENAIIHGNKGIGEYKIRILISIHVNNIFVEQTGDECYAISFRAQRFLRYMIRRLAGACIEIASRESLSINDLRAVLEKRNPAHTLPCAPACGLTLVKISYSL